MLVYFLLFGGNAGDWHHDDFLIHVRMCLQSILATTPMPPEVLFMCDPTKSAGLRGLPETQRLTCHYHEAPHRNIMSSMCRRFDIFDALDALGLAPKKVLYVDADAVFCKSAHAIFDLFARDGVLYAKPEKRFDPAQFVPYFCLNDEGTLPVPYINSGQFGFVAGPRTRALFAEFKAAVPSLAPRSMFLDQPVLNSFFRSRHNWTPCLDTKAIDPFVCLDPFEPSSRDTVMTHFLDHNKIPRMERLMPENVYYACVLMETVPERVQNYRDAIEPFLPGLVKIPAINGKDPVALSAALSMFKNSPRLSTLYEKCMVAAKASHMKAMMNFLGTEARHGCITEDDAKFDSRFNDRLRECLVSLPSGYDLLYVYVPDYDRLKYPLEEGKVSAAHSTYSACTYVVSRSGARRILDALEQGNEDLPIDVVMNDAVSSGDIGAYWVNETISGNVGQPFSGATYGLRSEIWNDRN